MEAKTQQSPDRPASHIGAALADPASVRRDKKESRATSVREPSMHALRRVLGDEVLDIFPEGIVDTVDGLFVLHGEDKDAWAEVQFETAGDRNDALALMRAYAECADDPGYTIRTDTTTEPDVLRFRVVVRKGSGSGE